MKTEIKMPDSMESVKDPTGYRATLTILNVAAVVSTLLWIIGLVLGIVSITSDGGPMAIIGFGGFVAFLITWAFIRALTPLVAAAIKYLESKGNS